MTKLLATSGNKKFIDGYSDDLRQASANMLCPPSLNVDISKTGEAIYRKGTLDTDIDLSEALEGARPFHVPIYNVTFFAANGSVYFVNHNNSDAVVDTGLSLSETTGRNTRFAEYAGDIYLTNRTDGLWQIHMGFTNGAASSGAATITVDQNLAGRLISFSDTASTLRIANSTPITELMASVAATGVVTLDNTLGANVPDDTIVYTVEDISSGRPKGSGITFWKERLIIWGVVDDQNTYNSTAIDNAPSCVYMSKFALRDSLEDIISFDVTSTATIEQIGKAGIVTNVLSTRDYLYIFTKDNTFFSSVADVSLTTGATLPQILSNQYGCVNEDCAADLGNGLIAFMTNNRRIIGIRISTESGAAVVFPDESLDVPLRNTVALLDTDQSDSFFFYAPSERRLFVHCDIDTTRTVLKFNNEIQAWEPPTIGWSMGGMYIKDGVLYATELTDDTIYECNNGFQDNGSDYEVMIATSLIEAEDGRMTLDLRSVGISGRIGELTTVTVESIVSGGTPQQKEFTADSFVSQGSIGSVPIGSDTLGDGEGEEMQDYDKLYAIYPRYGSSYQLRVSAIGDSLGGAFSVSSYTVTGKALSRPLLTLK